MKLKLIEATRSFFKNFWSLELRINYILQPWQLEKFDVFMQRNEGRTFSLSPAKTGCGDAKILMMKYYCLHDFH
jgi:hypothetical protein